MTTGGESSALAVGLFAGARRVRRGIPGEADVGIELGIECVDLGPVRLEILEFRSGKRHAARQLQAQRVGVALVQQHFVVQMRSGRTAGRADVADDLALPDRKSVVWGKRLSVRVDLGGRRNVKQKKRNRLDDISTT